ncbi:MAG: RNA polymerase sigma-54 factor [Phycisphaeraceae bacterium]|nr:MAG: RNA polymerase sigma-54 factor [Phycisphaeraceae bacterium]
MRFDTSQHMKLGQQMKLAPRMIQSMEILQMPLAELEERIEQELESNPTLELSDGSSEDAGGEDRERASDGDAATDLGEANAGDGADDFARLNEFEADNPEYTDNAYDGAYERDRGSGTNERAEHTPTYSEARHAGERDGKMDAMASAPARSASLADQLLGQWGLVDVDDRLRPLGAQIIEFLDDDGFLRTELGEVADRAPEGVKSDEPTAADWELALRAVQVLLEPAGVAARDARECLLLQLDAIEDQAEGDDDLPRVGTAAGLEAARTLIADHFDDLMNNRLPRIASKSGLTLEEINAGIEVMRRLSLAPARRLVHEQHTAITPDAEVEYDDENDRYVAYLTDSRASQLQINRDYALMAKDRKVDQKDRNFIRTNLSNAQWLLDAVGQRRSTMLRVINVVVEEQREFFDYGPEALKPLPMKTVADRLGVHVATVSRAVADKWVQTPRGVVALRGFFTQGLATESGEDVSANEVRAALKDIVDSEDKAKPYSDESLVKQLKERGYDIARRTVAKYRGQLDLPSARMRKQF